jgi:hypothetical protein
MTEPHSQPHGIQPASSVAGVQHATTSSGRQVPSYFTAEEWEQLERSDLGAGKVVIALLTSIFVVGLILYTTIAIIVAS